MQSETTPGRPEGAPQPSAGASPPDDAASLQARTPTPAPALAPAPAAPQRRGLWSFWPVATLLLLLGATVWLALHHDLATDWLLLRGYKPAANVQALADQDGMTAYARRLFYVNKPEIQGRDKFNKNCTNTFDQVSVLGCFAGDRQGIFIYNVTEKRLDGIQQVTAAHEMLHQAYDRLGSKERASIDAQLEAYAKTVTDPELLEKIESYKESEPQDLVNEYHSIFGTEVRTLPEGLEAYYARYFEKRSTVVGLYEQYQAVFNGRTKQIAAYDAQLDSLKTRIDTGKDSIKSQEAALEAARAQLDAYLAAKNISAYNAAVPGFNSQVDTYKATVAETNSLIEQYNSLIDERNKIAVEEQQLQNAIDSNASSASEQ